MYLRTLCERKLYLSLFSNNPGDFEKAGIPVPLKSRPGVQLITASGREFEYEQYKCAVQFGVPALGANPQQLTSPWDVVLDNQSDACRDAPGTLHTRLDI